MSQKNVEIVRAVYNRWGDGDFRADIDLLDPHVVLVLGPGFSFDAGMHSGIEGVAAYTRSLLEPWTHLTMEAEEIVEAGDSVLVGVRQCGVGRSSGVPTVLNYFTAWTFRGSKVVHLESFRGRAEALEAVGLKEEETAMSQENTELAYRSSEAFNRRDLDAVLALMDDDVEVVSRLVSVEGGYHGHEGIRRWWKNLLDAFPDFTVEIDEVRELGDLTVAAVRVRGHGASSDAPFEMATWQVSEWRRGKCIWWRMLDSQSEAFEAVGLSEQDAHAGS
jgi:ketosteroid isomerase-like protein